MSRQNSTDDVSALERAISKSNCIGQMLVGDPDRGRICAEVARVSATAAKQGLIPTQVEQSASSEVCTARARYRISATYINGERQATPDTIVVLIDPVDSQKFEAREIAARFFLTRREMETAHLLRKGLSTREIASALGISVNTARRHVERILLKLDLHSRAAVVARLGGLSTLCLMAWEPGLVLIGIGL